MGLFSSKVSANKSRLEAALKNASTYEEWVEIARELDVYEGLDEWRLQDESIDYDHELIRRRFNELRSLRFGGDVEKLVFALHAGLHGNLGNMANPFLYQHARVGTKKLIEDYLEEVEACLIYICDNEFDNFDLGAKLRFFKRTGISFGRSSLLLSGGATLGIFHLGVVKALWSQRLLPRVITGSSAGSILATLVGSHTEDEMDNIFDPGYFSLQAWKALGVKEAISGGSIMDGKFLGDCIKENIGDRTFEEAFERTKRLINITVSPADPHQQGRMLNYLTSPSVQMWSASLASCSIPGVFPPVELMAKNFEGEDIAYMAGRRWIDGSIASDLPMNRIARLHNVNHYIVSQTNPHIVPFMSQPKRQKRGVVPFTKEFVTSSYSFYSKNVMDLAIKHLNPSGGVGRIAEKIQSITTQQYSGDITIYPHRMPNLLKVFGNPSMEDVSSFIAAGERDTWPEIERIRNATRISRAFEACLFKLKTQEHLLAANSTLMNSHSDPD